MKVLPIPERNKAEKPADILQGEFSFQRAYGNILRSAGRHVAT